MEAVESKRIGKYLIKVVQDEMADSPDCWGNDDAFVVYDHRQFYVKREGFAPRDIFDSLQLKSNKWGMYDKHYVFVLYAYIHSGVALSVGDHNFPDARWDVSSTGFVLVKRQKGMYDRKKAFKLAEAVTEEWNQYLSGDVYGYKIYDMTGADVTEEDEDEGEEMVESCWGFYGDHEYCMTEAVSVVEHLIEKDKHGQLELELNS
jgi:hypothetical protein